jgi:dephospho-CoA kinase
MIVVGLTGGIASGKSTVVRMFAEEGAWIIDLDEISRWVVQPRKPAWREIVRSFGESILKRDGTIDRKRMSEIVFADPSKRRRLEEIVHPYVFKEYDRRLRGILDKNEQAIVIADVPLLIEIQAQHRFEKVILVYSPPETQVARLKERNGLDHRAVLDRLGAQMAIDQKVGVADFVIDNQGSLEETRRQVRRVYEALVVLERERVGEG